MLEIDWSGLSETVLVIAIVVVVLTGLVAAYLLVKMVMTFRQVNQRDTPFVTKFVYYASLVYTIVPTDLLPDPALLDDIGVLAGAMLFVGQSIKKKHKGRSQRPPADVSESDQAELPRGS